MSRPVDWTPLSRDSDPVPGDAWQVEQSGKAYQEVAEAISTAARRLREIADDSAMQSVAVDEFRGKARSVASDIDRAYDRYKGVGDALVAYAGPLETAQADSARALTDALSAQGELESGQTRLSNAESRLANAADDTDTSEIEADIRQAEDDVAAAESSLTSAHSRCDDAEDDRDRAANVAIAAIREVEDSGDLNDGWWDNWGSKIVSVIAEVAGAVAAIAGVAALLVGWIPIIGQALAGILGTIALIAGVISLLANIALASTGYGSWTNVLLDAISVATFGLGRAVVAGGRAAIVGTRGASRLAAGRVVAQGGRRIRALTGADDIANLTRSQARSLARQGRNTPLFNLRAPFSAARNEIMSLPSRIRSLPSMDWSRAFSETPDALRGLKNSGSFDEFAARFTQNADELAHLNVLQGLDDVLANMDEVAAQIAKASNAINLGHISIGTGGLVDGFQFVNLFDGGSSPSDTLNLPEKP